MIIRLYECFNKRTEAEISFALNIKQAFECNLLEQDELAAQVTGNTLKFTIKPYEIKTFKITF